MSERKSRPSLQDVLKRRQTGAFVGRDEQIASFRENLALSLDDDRRHFVFCIYGQGGVGKTSLLRQYVQLAEAQASVSWVDEAQIDTVDAMRKIAERIATQDGTFKSFTERFHTFVQKRQEMEADPEAPRGLSAIAGSTLAKVGFSAIHSIPMGTLVSAAIDEEAVAKQAGEWANYLIRKLTNKDELELMRKPIDVLTPLWLEGLNRAAEYRPVALFFDTYEVTGHFLDSWLRALLDGRYGAVTRNILITIAGRDKLDRNLWDQYEPFMEQIELPVFTNDQARKYLDHKGIVADHIVSTILQLSGRLPLLLATLAAENPKATEDVGEPNGIATERFLKWVKEPSEREFILRASLLRRINRDIVNIISDEERSDVLFARLTQKPFVQERSDGWTYHSVVREQFLRYQRRASPKTWTDLHERVAAYYAKLQNEAMIQTQDRPNDLVAVSAAEAIYHQLCASPDNHIAPSLRLLLMNLSSQNHALRLAQAIRDAGVDSSHTEVHRWGQFLVDILSAVNGDTRQVRFDILSELLREAPLDNKGRRLALADRGVLRIQREEYREADDDFSAALSVESNEPEAKGRLRLLRGIARFHLGEYSQAMSDIEEAFSLGIGALPEHQMVAFGFRGVLQQVTGHFDKAIADFTEIVRLFPNNPAGYEARGEVFLETKNYERAAEDFGTVINLRPTDSTAFLKRANANQALARWRDCDSDLTQAIQLDAGLNEVIAMRAIARLEAEDYDGALDDANSLVNEGFNLALSLPVRGFIYLQVQRYDEALTDLNDSINLDPATAWTYLARASVYEALGDTVRAEADFGRARELDPTLGWTRPPEVREAMYSKTERLGQGER